jgi:hypothetical protein
MIQIFNEKEDKTDVNLIFSMESLMNFKDNSLKLQILEQIYEDYSRNPEKIICILDTEKYKFHSRFHVAILSDKLVQFVNCRQDGINGEHEMTFLFSPVVARLLKGFYLYLSGSDMCLDRENSLNILRICIETCKRKGK